MDIRKRRLEEQLCFSLQTASKQFTRMYTKALEPFQLTYPQYLVLLVLWEHESDQSISALGERLELDTGTLTPMLKRMEKNGYITRKRSEQDERVVLISLSEKAYQLESEIYCCIEGCLSQLAFVQGDYHRLLEQVNEVSEQIAELLTKE